MGRRNNGNNNWNNKPSKDRDGKHRKETARERRARLKHNEEAQEFCLQVLPFFLVGVILFFTSFGFFVSRVPVGYFPAISDLQQFPGSTQGQQCMQQQQQQQHCEPQPQQCEPQPQQCEPQPQQCNQGPSDHPTAQTFIEDVIDAPYTRNNDSMKRYDGDNYESSSPQLTDDGWEENGFVSAAEDGACNGAVHQPESTPNDFILEEVVEDLDDIDEQQQQPTQSVQPSMRETPRRINPGTVKVSETLATPAIPTNPHTSKNGSRNYEDHDSHSENYVTVVNVEPSSTDRDSGETWSSKYDDESPEAALLSRNDDDDVFGKPRKQVLKVYVDQSSASADSHDNRNFIHI